MKGLLKDRVEGRIFVTRVCLGVVLTSRLSCGESFISDWWKPKGRDWYVVFLLEDLSRYKEWVQGKPLPTFAVCHVLLKQKWKWSRSVVSNSFRPMDCSPPGSSIHGIFRARVLEWGAISFSRGSSDVPLKSSSLIPIMIYLSPKLYSHSCPLWPQSCAWVHRCLVTSVVSDSMHTCGL